MVKLDKYNYMYMENMHSGSNVNMHACTYRYIAQNVQGACFRGLAILHENS